VIKKDGIVISTLYADKNGNFEFKADKNSSYTFEINETEYEAIKEDYSTIGKTVSDSTFKKFVLQSNIDVLITVINEKTKQLLPNSKIEILNKKTNEIISGLTDDLGVIQFKLPRNSEFEILTVHSDYLDSKSVLSTVTKDKVVKTTIGLNLIQIGSILAVKDLNYDFEKWTIKPDSKAELDKVIAFLKANPKVKIELSSHTDCRGLADFNMRLSKKRNQSCIDYLVSKGVNKNRVIGKWFGESMLLNKCADDIECSEEEHKINRRTEVVVVSVD
jgi:peptidoglycan-associated lipoprotein